MTIAIITIVALFIVLGIIAIRRDLTHLRRQAVFEHFITDTSEEALDRLSDRNWKSIVPSVRALCKEHLKREIPQAAWQRWKTEGFDPMFHMYHGMAVRNLLRDVLLDKDLPGDKNWDDYYMGCLREILKEMK
jgi:hypothetical protein